MENKELEILKAEIERFKVESLKTHVVKVWAESYTNSDPFDYSILEKENNKVWWMKTQAHQLWEMWQAAKATPEGFVLVPRECPDPIFADKLFDHLCKKAHGEFGDDQMIFFSDIDESAIWQLMIEAQEQSHD